MNADLSRRSTARAEVRKILASGFRFLISFLLISGFWFPASALASCFNPAGAAGDLRYNGGYGVYQYCNGGAWVNIGRVGSMTGGLVGWWKFDETSGLSASDSSGAGNTGTLQAAASWTTSGMNNGALAFDGATQYVDVLDAPSLDISGSFTLATWVNLNALPAASSVFGLFLKNGTGGSATNYELDVDNGYFGAGIGWVINYNSTGCCDDRYAKYVTTINTGTWYHVAAVYDSVAHKQYLYLNGSLVATNDVTGLPPETGAGSDLQMGYSNFGTYLPGTLDDSRIYNRALSAADIHTLYTSTGGTSGDINSNLAGYWKFDEASGTKANDSTGNGNTGTLINAPAWAAGKVNGALTFTFTSSQYVSVPDTVGLRFGTGDFTVAAWINFPLSGSAAGFAGIVSKGYSTSAPAHVWGLIVGSPNTDEACFQDATDAGGAFGDCNVCSGQVAAGWHHIVVTRTGGTCTEYTDGAVLTYPGGNGPTSSGAAANLSTAAPLEIGRDSLASSRYFGGTVDDVRLYTRALSPSDVLTLYNTTNTACASPTGYAGDEIYNAGANHVLQYCNGTNWVRMGKVPGAGGAGCSNPAGNEGDTIYSKDYLALQYCDGTNWVVMGTRALTGLIHWWNLDEAPGTTTAADSVGGVTLSKTGTVDFTTGGKINNALSLPNDATAHYFGVAGGPADILNVSQLTMTGWIKQVDTVHTLQVGQQNGVSTDAIDFGPWSDGNIYFELGGGSQSFGNIANTLDTNWHHIAMVFDGTQATNATRLKAYIDGVQQTITYFFGTIPATTTANAQPFQIGTMGGGDTAGAGLIDDVRIYNRALTAAEIRHIYDGAP